MFASKTISTVTIGAVIVTIAKLSGKKLSEAADVQHERVVLSALRLSKHAGEQMQDALTARAEEKRQELEQQKRAEAEGQPPAAVDTEALKVARYRRYDRDTVLRSGIRSWKSADNELLPSVQTGVDDLEDFEADMLHRAILDLTLPPIDVAAVETDRKKS